MATRAAGSTGGVLTLNVDGIDNALLDAKTIEVLAGKFSEEVLSSMPGYKVCGHKVNSGNTGFEILVKGVPLNKVAEFEARTNREGKKFFKDLANYMSPKADGKVGNPIAIQAYKYTAAKVSCSVSNSPRSSAGRDETEREAGSPRQKVLKTRRKTKGGTSMSEITIMFEKRPLGVMLKPKSGRFFVHAVSASELQDAIPVGAVISKIEGRSVSSMDTAEGKELLVKGKLPLQLTFECRTKDLRTLQPMPQKDSALHFAELNQAWRRVRSGGEDDANTQMYNCDRRGAQFVLRATPAIQEHYQLEGTLGSPGAFGICKTCKRLRDGRVFAVKIISKFKYNDAKKRRMFFKDLRNEIMMMVRARGHPNIIDFEEVFEDLKHLYVVMEHCSGGELFDRIDQEEGFSELDAVRVLQQMFYAMHFLHRKRIIHCDLKPENFLFKSGDPNSENYTNIKLIDFGMAKVVKYADKADVLQGTPYYLAPEVLEREYDESADIWSLGVVTFVMIFNTPPFWGPSDDKIYERIKYGFIPQVREHYGPWFPAKQPVSGDCRDFISQCLISDKTKKGKARSAMRMTAEEALEHPWMDLIGGLQSSTPLQRKIADTAVLNSLVTFKKQARLQNVVLDYLGKLNYLTPTQIEHLRNSFEEMDTNHDGHIDEGELFAALQLIDPQVSADEVAEIFNAIDSDHNGSLDYSEFLPTRLNRKVASKEARLKATFDLLDLNSNGRLSIDEVQSALTYVYPNRKYTKQQVIDIVEEVDADHDGHVEYSEFMGMWNPQNRHKSVWVTDRPAETHGPSLLSPDDPVFQDVDVAKRYSLPPKATHLRGTR